MENVVRPVRLSWDPESIKNPRKSKNPRMSRMSCIPKNSRIPKNPRMSPVHNIQENKLLFPIKTKFYQMV